MTPGLRLSKDDTPKTREEERAMAKRPYMNAVGAINYAAVATRPDIAHAVRCLARHNNNPGEMH